MNFGDEVEVLDEKEVSKFPYNCIGYLRFRGQGGNPGKGTGFLIAPDLVLTVAHNVYSQSYRKEYTDFLFYPGVSG
jgi:V8-like Glu-specific endopeptidase